MLTKFSKINTPDNVLNQIQNTLVRVLNPLLSNPANDSIILSNITLVTGSNTISHKLGRTLQGWKIIRKRAVADVYDAQDTNSLSNKTLILVSSANVTLDLEIF